MTLDSVLLMITAAFILVGLIKETCKNIMRFFKHDGRSYEEYNLDKQIKYIPTFKKPKIKLLYGIESEKQLKKIDKEIKLYKKQSELISKRIELLADQRKKCVSFRLKNCR